MKCAYCGEERKLIDLKEAKIIFRSRTPSGKAIVDTKSQMYCKDKNCAIHDQMA